MTAGDHPVTGGGGTEPLVGIMTPVHNGELYLWECIESVMRQTYRNWEYVIVNNCSTDRTRQIADSYAAHDPRIRVHNNETFVSAMQNHNLGLTLIPASARYCKIVHADDWLFPECLARMVALAEEHPSTGIIGAYGLEGTRVVWDGLPPASTFIPGREIGRWYLQGRPNVLGTPTSVLYRADLVRARQPFFNEQHPLWADLDACLFILQRSDYGFVHQVLTFTRRHEGSTSRFAQRVNTYVLGHLELLQRYGSFFLERGEYEARLTRLLREYRRFLGRSLITRGRDNEFWQYHMGGLRALGFPLSRTAVVAAAAGAVIDVLLDPLRMARSVLSGADGGRRKVRRPKQRTSTEAGT